MTLVQKKAKLKAKAQAGLTNPAGVKDSDVDSAIAETEAIVSDKNINDAYYIDIAYLRYLSLVGATVKEIDENLYDKAIKQLSVVSATQVVDSKDVKSYGVKVEQRKGIA